MTDALVPVDVEALTALPLGEQVDALGAAYRGWRRAEVADTFPLGLAAFASLVDGRYSRGMGDLRGIVGSATFGAYMALYHGGSGDMTLFEKLRSRW